MFFGVRHCWFNLMTGHEAGRREFLAAVGSASIGVLAGCSNGGENGASATDSATRSPTSSSTPTTQNQEAVEHYETAIEALINTKEILDEWADSSFEGDKVASLQDRVSTAREELDAAAAAADQTGELIVQINQAKLVANFQTLSLDYYEAINVFYQVVSDASNLGDSELHQRAAESYTKAKDVLDDARTVIEDMGTILEKIENESLEPTELEYSGEPLDHLDLADIQAIDGAESYVIGNENLHLAFVQLENGQAHYESEAFTEAREAWETGRQRAKDSKAALEKTLDNDFTPQDLRQVGMNKLRYAETLIEAYDTFIEGATEAEAGNREKANTLIAAGFDILNQL